MAACGSRCRCWSVCSVLRLSCQHVELGDKFPLPFLCPRTWLPLYFAWGWTTESDSGKPDADTDKEGVRQAGLEVTRAELGTWMRCSDHHVSLGSVLLRL